MSKKIPLLFSILLCVSTQGFSQPLQKAIVNGKIFSVSGNADQDIIFAYNGHAFQPDDGAIWAGVRSILADESHTFVIVEENGGGSASALQFRIVDVSNPDHPIMSDTLGESVGDTLVTDWTLNDGGVGGEFQANDGSFTLECQFKDGKTSVIKKQKKEILIGPDQAPGGDPAVFANDKPILIAFHQKFIANKLQDILPKDVFVEARKIAYQNQTVLFSSSHNTVSAKASEKYDEGEWISIAIEHDGKVSAAFSWGDNKPVYYGAPSELTKFAL